MFGGKMEGHCLMGGWRDRVQNFCPNSFPPFPLICFVKWGEVGPFTFHVIHGCLHCEFHGK